MLNDGIKVKWKYNILIIKVKFIEIINFDFFTIKNTKLYYLLILLVVGWNYKKWDDVKLFMLHLTFVTTEHS